MNIAPIPPESAPAESRLQTAAHHSFGGLLGPVAPTASPPRHGDVRLTHLQLPTLPVPVSRLLDAFRQDRQHADARHAVPACGFLSVVASGPPFSAEGYRRFELNFPYRALPEGR